jgi:hypothetical protein
VGSPLRNDFVEASATLTLPAQKRHLAELHAWLVDGGRLLEGEKVVALTNFQQGGVGRMPVQILLVTTARVVFTHDDGIRAIPLTYVDTDKVGASAGVVHGQVTIPLRDGELLTFRRGMSLAMIGVAQALRAHGTPSPSRSARD